MSELIQVLRARLRAVLGISRKIAGSEQGVTIIELLTALAIIAVLAAMMMPWMRCQISKARYASMMEDLRHARAAIEAFETELGGWPCNLEQAFMGAQVPRSLSYCADNIDGNSGHGNEWCDFFDEDNPSGNNNHGGSPGVGYKLWTNWDFSACTGVTFAWYTCCGEEPTVCTEPDSGKKGKGGKNSTSPECNLGSHPGNVQHKMEDSGSCVAAS